MKNIKKTNASRASKPSTTPSLNHMFSTHTAQIASLRQSHSDSSQITAQLAQRVRASRYNESAAIKALLVAFEHQAVVLSRTIELLGETYIVLSGVTNSMTSLMAGAQAASPSTVADLVTYLTNGAPGSLNPTLSDQVDAFWADPVILEATAKSQQAVTSLTETLGKVTTSLEKQKVVPVIKHKEQTAQEVSVAKLEAALKEAKAALVGEDLVKSEV